jgi:hypothetical protein
VSLVEAPVITPSAGVLLVVLGLQRIDCGVWCAQRGTLHNVQSVPVLRQAGEAHPLVLPLQKLHVDLQTQAATLGHITQVCVLVFDGWLAVTSVPWSTSLKRADTAIAFARGQLQDAGFDVALDDVLKLDNAPYGQPRLAMAYPANVLAALRQLAGSVDAPLVSVLSMAVAAWGLTRSKHAALAVTDNDMLLLLRAAHPKAARLFEVTTRHHSTATLSSVWQRVCTRDAPWAHLTLLPVLTLGAPHEAFAAPFTPLAWPAQPVIKTQAPGSLKLAALGLTRHHVLDAMPATATRMSLWRWSALGVAAVLTSAVLWQVLRVHHEADTLAAQLKARRPAPVVVAPVAALTREELARAQAVNTAIRSLNLPMAALLNALQAPQDIRVAVLSVDSGGASSTVKVQAEARSVVDMTRYIAWVAQRKPFVAAQLTAHELTPASPEPHYRFTLEAQWSD